MTRAEKLKRATGRKPSEGPVRDFKHTLRNAVIGCAILTAVYAAGYFLGS